MSGGGAFAEKVLASFRNANIEVRQWVCCLEAHQDGGQHFHMAIKLGGLHRWIAVKNYLAQKHGIVCHVSGLHSSYYTTWKKRLSAYDVSRIIMAQGITSQVELLAFADQQLGEGKTDLAQFVFNRGAKCVAETMKVTGSASECCSCVIVVVADGMFYALR